MSTFVLISGTLFKNAEERTSSKSGRVFVSAVIKVGGENGDAEFWTAMVFSQSAQSELLRLSAGDALSVQGKAKIELWQRDGGEPKISRSIFAEAVLPLRAAPRERRSKQATAQTPLLDHAAPPRPTAPPSDLNDDIPF